LPAFLGKEFLNIPFILLICLIAALYSLAALSIGKFVGAGLAKILRGNSITYIQNPPFSSMAVGFFTVRVNRLPLGFT